MQDFIRLALWVIFVLVCNYLKVKISSKLYCKKALVQLKVQIQKKSIDPVVKCLASYIFILFCCRLSKQGPHRLIDLNVYLSGSVAISNVLGGLAILESYSLVGRKTAILTNWFIQISQRLSNQPKSICGLVLATSTQQRTSFSGLRENVSSSTET